MNHADVRSTDTELFPCKSSLALEKRVDCGLADSVMNRICQWRIRSIVQTLKKHSKVTRTLFLFDNVNAKLVFLLLQYGFGRVWCQCFWETLVSMFLGKKDRLFFEVSCFGTESCPRKCDGIDSYGQHNDLVELFYERHSSETNTNPRKGSHVGGYFSWCLSGRLSVFCVELEK